MTVSVASEDEAEKVISFTIANGESLSESIDITGIKKPRRVIMPSAWTAANLTFQGSYDDSTFNDVYDYNGTELNVTAAASRTIELPFTTLDGIRYLKVRSGTAGVAVNQGAERTLYLVCGK